MTTTSGTVAAEEVPPNQPAGQLSAAASGYIAKVRGGDVGALPAVLGFIVLVIFFSAAQGNTFDTKLNWVNLLNQSAAVMFIAMGLVFVLLLGEIDLSAGYAAGGAASVLAVLLQHHNGWLVSVVAALLFGVVVGLLIGLLVARLGIPSFVVTLAFFLALQGVQLAIIGQGGTIGLQNSTILKLMSGSLSVLAGWIFFLLVVGGYAAIEFIGLSRRRAAGLPGAPAVVAAKVLALAVLLGVVVGLLNQERALNPAIKSLKGVPLIVPFAAIFVVVLTFVLGRTSFGRHVYAVGGNAEAARRSGINVGFIRIACFVIGSTMAAVGGIILASRDGGVSGTTGGAQTLLYAVGAAVIGGTSLFGGKGRILDAVIGGLVIAVIGNGLPLITQQASVQFIVTGIVLLLAASVDAISRRRAAASGR